MAKIKITPRQEIEAKNQRAEQARLARVERSKKVKDWQRLSGKDKDDLLRELCERYLRDGSDNGDD